MEFAGVYVSALFVGLLGGMHCIGMCGGISSALGFAVDSKSGRKNWPMLIAYNSGRLFSYTLLGLFVGLLSQQLSTHAHHSMSGHGIQLTRIFAGLLLIAMSLYLSGLWYGLRVLEKAGHLVWKRIQVYGKNLLPLSSVPQAFALGILWGWMPCGLIYSALAYSAAQSNFLVSGGTMFFFGVGTLPAVLASGIFAVKIKQILQKKNLRQVFALALFVFGVWTLWGGLGLGLPHN